MKTIILAAGLGTRLGDRTVELPKGMIEFQGSPLIKWQIDSLRAAGIEDIVVITGHCASCINFSDVTYVHNPKYATTNMLESLMCAREHLNDGFILSYADIIYEKGIVGALLSSPVDIGVVADVAWRRYWEKRFGSAELDLETFSVDSDGAVTELGRPADSSCGITHRYVGLLKFSAKGAKSLMDVYDNRKQQRSVWPQSGKEFEQGYMTDILHQLIEHGDAVRVVETVNGWMEFDEPSDFEIADSLWESGRLGQVGNFNPIDVLRHKKILNYRFAQVDAESVPGFIRKRNADARKIGIRYSVKDFCVNDIKGAIEPESRRELFGWEGFFIKVVLRDAIAESLNNPFNREAIRVIDLLQQRFEVTKNLYSVYCGEDLRNGFGPFQYAENYIYFAYAMAVKFYSTQRTSYLNTLLKVNDLLLSGVFELEKSLLPMLEYSLNSEADIIGRYHEIE